MRDVKCKNCINYMGNWCDKVRDDPYPDDVRDCQYFRHMTNADKIRKMTDEELADWLCGLVTEFNVSIVPQEWFDWLKQEVEE